ncbi:hypothetical protein B0O99DRAFT_665263 [Bisporella sp. PMI_857]|nr:hypothetical protein B0O99DRAFT_665263 [Bisporella sp. PMI_857]
MTPCVYDPDTDIENDKDGFLEDCFAWILHDVQLRDWQGNKDTQLWIKGDPGQGKAMLMIGLSLSFFFCKNAEHRFNNGVSVLRGLIWKLLSEIPALGCYIPKAYHLATKDKRKAMMLSDVLMNTNFETVYLLVDALDECDKDMDRLVEWIAHNAADPQSKAKWLVSGRCTMKLDRTSIPKHHRKKLILELNDGHISQAVARFIKQKVDALAYGVPKSEIMTELDKFPPGLPPLYERMMQLIENQGSAISNVCERIPRVVTIAYNSLTLGEIRSIENICELVSLCGSYLILRKMAIYFVHQSAKDYLDGVAEFFPGGHVKGHRMIASRSLQAMSTTLRKDIYNLRDPGFSIKEIKSGCDEVGLCDGGEVHVFLQKHFLRWLEVLSLMRSISSAVATIRKLENLLLSLSSKIQIMPWILSIVRDAHRFVLYNRGIIENAPLQAYASALVFSPSMSKIRTLFQDQQPSWIRTSPLVEEDWNPCLQTLEGHTGSVKSITFFPDGQRLASASSDDGTVRVWDVETGALQQTLEAGTPFKAYQTPNWSAYCLHASKSWITWNGKKVLWLPSEHRPVVSAVRRETIMIGCSSGRLLFFRFHPKIPPLRTTQL